MMTKTERADLLLDAIGMIGDDIIAESSGLPGAKEDENKQIGIPQGMHIVK